MMRYIVYKYCLLGNKFIPPYKRIIIHIKQYVRNYSILLKGGYIQQYKNKKDYIVYNID